MSGNSNPPPGWYPNPERAGTMRYWNGELWTDHVHEPEAPQAPVSAGLPGPPPPAGQQFGGQPQYGQFAYAGGPAGKPETPGFIGAYKDALSNYVNFSGRLSVGGYWRFFAINVAIAIGLAILSAAAELFFIFYVLYGLAMFLPGLAAAIRRMHDTGKSGWAILIALIPVVGAIVLIVWLVQSGNPGQNAYGPPPT